MSKECPPCLRSQLTCSQYFQPEKAAQATKNRSFALYYILILVNMRQSKTKNNHEEGKLTRETTLIYSGVQQR